MRKNVLMEKLSVVWDDHVKNYSVGHHWLSTEHKTEVDPEDNEKEGVYFPISLPGDDNFEED